MKTVDETEIWMLGVDDGKEAINHRLTIKKPGGGFCHFPSNSGRGYDETYYQGLLSETKNTFRKNGRLVTKWVKKRGVRNEPLDLFNYNYAACLLLNPDWDSLEMKLAEGKNYMKRSVRRRVVRRRSSGQEIKV